MFPYSLLSCATLQGAIMRLAIDNCSMSMSAVERALCSVSNLSTYLKKFTVAAGQIGSGGTCLAFPGKRGRDPDSQEPMLA